MKVLEGFAVKVARSPQACNMTAMKTQLNTILSDIEQCREASLKQQETVKLLAVSKTQSAEKIHQAFQLGQSSFGENYLQEALIKITALNQLDIEWHFIGPIQSNKTRDIAANFDWVQSIDRLKIARRLSEQRPNNLAKLNLCIQVNIDNETSKSGVSPDEVVNLAEQLQQFDNLQLRGLMIIPSKDNNHQQRDAFQHAYVLYQQLADNYPGIDTLSMGMSADKMLAIEGGSTMVRIGTALFGQRNT